MKFLYFIASIKVAFLLSASAQPTDIGGIINIYTPVTAIDTSDCNDVLTVTAVTGFNVGDTVMIIQMKGAIIDTSNSSSFGTILNLGEAGNYEFSSITSVTGNQVEISGSLQNNYYVPGHVQLVRVPVYSDADVTTTLTAQDWDGTDGGVLVLFVNDTLYLNADINLDGIGFRGGAISLNPDGGCGNNDINDYYYDVNQGGSSWLEGGAQKGEGITEISSSKMGGKGCLANGGGGGNKHNTGGGGGGNYTAGGKGGKEMEGCFPNGNGGRGGVSLPYNMNKIFLGGGGGCGDFNNSVGTVGTDAGGIVIIKAATIVGNNYTIHTNGLDQTGSIGSIGDGAGGGGAGGTILLTVPNFSGNLTLQASGGDGGDQTASNTWGCFGPGGGGGTGVIWISGSSLPASVITEMLPGAAGIILNTSFSCYNTTYGATDGINSSNSYLTNLILPLLAVMLGNDTALCTGDTLILDASQLSGTYLWNTGATTSSIVVDTSGSYWVQVNDGCGITADTIDVSFLPPPEVMLGNDTVLCAIDTLILDGTQLSGTYLWNTGAITSSIVVDTSGSYWVQVNNGCGIGSDTINVSFLPSQVVMLGNDTVLCIGDTLTLEGTQPSGTYLWNTGAITSSIVVDTSGSYWVQVNNGCELSTDTIEVSFLPPPVVMLGNDTTICPNTTMWLDATTLGGSYQWQDGSTNPFYFVDSFGSYSITVAIGSCIADDTIQIEYFPPLLVNLEDDTFICEDGTLLLDATYVNGISYLWQDGSTNPTFLADTAGMYFVKVTDNDNCKGSDTVIISTMSPPTVHLRNDTTTCVGTKITLHAYYPDATYLWSNNQTADSIEVADTAHYWVIVTNVCGSVTDTFSMKFIDCGINIFVPNVFSPNGDGLNDVFKPIATTISYYSIEIFNRWGQLIFHSGNQDDGWDGTLNNKNEEIGVYVYVINYISSLDPLQERKQLAGNITLIR